MELCKDRHMIRLASGEGSEIHAYSSGGTYSAVFSRDSAAGVNVGDVVFYDYAPSFASFSSGKRDLIPVRELVVRHISVLGDRVDIFATLPDWKPAIPDELDGLLEDL